MDYIEVPLTHITIFDGARVTSVADPHTGKRRTHGLGAVGDPLTPYLDHRTEGYLLVVSGGAQAPLVREVDTRAKPLASGKYPSRRLPWSAAGAPDVDPFADWKARR